MHRWSYLLPRLVILGLLCLAVFIGRDALIRRVVISQMQNATMAKAEIGQLQSSIGKNRLFLKNLKIADPRDPMTNLLQADVVFFSLDRPSFLRRRIVIQDGSTSQLMLGAPRTTSGALDDTQTETEMADLLKGKLPRNFEAESESLGRAWLDRMHPDQGLSSSQLDFELVSLAKERRDRWQQLLGEYREKVEKLRPAIIELRSQFDAKYENPLRDPLRFRAVSSELQRLESESALIRGEIQRLQIGLSAEKESLIAAKTRDEQKLRQLTRSNQFDGQAVSQLLLHQSQGQLIEDLVDWFDYFQSAIPDPTTDLNPDPVRGINVAFQGTHQHPGFLIEQLQLEGEGRFAGQHFNFAGTAFDVSNQPWKHDQPARFELRAQGNQHLIIQCELDRRSETPVDRLTIHCPELELDAQTLGTGDSLLVSLGEGSRVQAEINLELEGDQLSGNLVLRHSDVALHVDQLHALAGGEDTALRLNQDLARVNEFKTEVSLAGSLEDYQFDLTSDLGSKFSATVDRVVIADVEQQIRQQQDYLAKILANEIENLENSVAPAIETLASSIRQDVMLMAEMSKTIKTSLEETRPQFRR